MYSQAVASRLGADYPQLRAEVRVTSPSIDLERFSRPRNEDIRGRWGAGPDDIVIGVVARMQTHRLFPQLIEGFARAARDDERLRLVVLGRGTNRERVAHEVEQQMDPPEESGQLNAEEQEQLPQKPQTTGDAAQPTPVESQPESSRLLPPVAQTPDPLPTEPATGTRTRDLVRMSDVSRHVGQVLRVVADNGRTFQGRLVADNGTVLMFEKHYSSGMITVPWNKSEIQSLYKVRKRP